MVLVIVLHGAVLLGLWHYKIRLSPRDAVPVFVNFIDSVPPAKKLEVRKPLPPKPPPPELPKPTQLVVEAPVVTPEEPVAPLSPPDPEPIVETPPEPAAPVMLSSHLSVTCPERSAPVYPAQSRNLGEQGRVVLWVELDERGRVIETRVSSSSGSLRLDNAAMAAVKTWKCNPALRDGIAVRGIALQPFDFILKGR